MLRKGRGNWVEGDRFFNREADLKALEDLSHFNLKIRLRAGIESGNWQLRRTKLFSALATTGPLCRN